MGTACFIDIKSIGERKGWACLPLSSLITRACEACNRAVAMFGGPPPSCGELGGEEEEDDDDDDDDEEEEKKDVVLPPNRRGSSSPRRL
jgi:hypothetical protein